MPRWRSAAIVLALLALAHPAVAATGALALQYLAHLHGHAHTDLGRAAEHGHQHAPSVVDHGHEATTVARAGDVAAPELSGLLIAAPSDAGPSAAVAAPGYGRGTGCDPPASALRSPVLRI